ncbi:MAG: TlpA family protein disulfide reductase, partial [Bacteroidia bacterium]|nr:TlpA family protein disulfide reductase [Bacteroidia bacterium]
LYFPGIDPQKFFTFAKIAHFRSIVETEEQWILEKGSDKSLLRYVFNKSDSLLVQVEERRDFNEKGVQYRAYHFHSQEYLDQAVVPENWYSRDLIPASYVEINPEQSRNSTPEIGVDAMAWVLPALDRDSIDLRNLRDTVVLLDFWYQSCGPCVKAMPALQSIQQEYRDRPFKVIGVNMFDENQDFMRKFLLDRGITYPIALARGRTDLLEAYGVNAYPTLVILNREQKIVFTQVGFSPIEKAALMRAIEAQF